MVKLWDVRDGNCLKVLSGHTSGVRSIGFSLDGRTLASSSAYLVTLGSIAVQFSCDRTYCQHRC